MSTVKHPSVLQYVVFRVIRYAICDPADRWKFALPHCEVDLMSPQFGLSLVPTATRIVVRGRAIIRANATP